MAWLVGIDVGGEKKGYHLAATQRGSTEIERLEHFPSPGTLVAGLASLSCDPVVIAIDAPPKCQIRGETTRLAERELHQAGFRVQWTRRPTHEPAEWMRSGEQLWEALSTAFVGSRLVECFPTAAGRNLGDSSLHLPLRLLAPHAKRREWKDFVDACLCLDVARRYDLGTARVFGEDRADERDELGPIYA